MALSGSSYVVSSAINGNNRKLFHTSSRERGMVDAEADFVSQIIAVIKGYTCNQGIYL